MRSRTATRSAIAMSDGKGPTIRQTTLSFGHRTLQLNPDTPCVQHSSPRWHRVPSCLFV